MCAIITGAVLGIVHANPPRDVEIVPDHTSRQEQMEALVDPDDYPHCVRNEDWPEGEIATTVVVVNDRTWRVKEVSLDRGWRQSQAGRVWIVLTCQPAEEAE